MPDNNIEWGQGAVNNTNDWGKAKANSTNNFGAVYDSSPSGDTNLTGGSAGLAQIDNVKSVEFDGIDENITITETTISRTSTISLWFNWADGVGLNILLGGNAQNYFGLRSVSGNLKFFIDGFPSSPTSEIQTNESFTVNTWYHLAIVQTETPSVATCYVNGVNKGNFNNGSRQLVIDKIGQWHTYLNYNFNGLIDEVAIFNTALTEEEVVSIYDKTETGKTADLNTLSTPPVAWYRMGDGDTYPTITDNAGSNDGTMTNMSSSNIVEDTPS